MIRLITTCLILCFINCLAISQSDVAYLNTESEKFSATNLAASYVPFSLQNGKIFINATIDGKRGSFILDTGATGIILNQKPNNTSKIKATGATGELSVGTVQVNSFEIGHLNLTDFEAYALDISHLEQVNKRDILGLVGFDVLSNFEVLFDCKQNQIVLLPNRGNQLHKESEPIAEWKFSLNGHLPVIKMKIGKQQLNIGIDSGAQDNLMEQKLFNKLPKQTIGKKGQMELRGLDGQITLVNTAWLSDATLKGHELSTMNYLFADLSAINDMSTQKIDGLLGFPFFEGKKISINYQKRKIYLWE